MKLGHVLLSVLLIGALSIPVASFLETMGVEPNGLAETLVLLTVVPVVAVIFAWPISRFLRLTPLMVFAGPCPGCRTRPPGWWHFGTTSDPMLLACGRCGTEVDLWLTRRPRGHATSHGRPAYRLRWPEFLGIWTRIPP
jgi:hypothetical protein